jgi:lysophospholipase L1-like esterase
MIKITYVAFGDSITEGCGVKKNFVRILSEKISKSSPPIDLNTVNSGMSGDNSRDGLYRLDRDVLSYDPDLVTVNFGVNDAFSGISAKQFADNLEKMAHRITASGCGRIVMLSCEVIPEPWAEKQVLPYWDAMADAAGRTGCVYADAHGRWSREIASGRPESDLLIPGDMHPNEEGHRIIAEAVWEAIKNTSLLESL